MNRNDKLKKLELLSELFLRDEHTTPDEVKEVFDVFTESTAQAIGAVNKKINSVHESHTQEHGDIRSELSTIESKVDNATRLLHSRIDTISLTPGKDGKDADEEKVVARLLETIKLPEQQAELQIVRDTAEDIRNKLELLEGEDRLDASAIKNLEDYLKKSETIAPMILSGSTGIKEIRAGTGVTIDNSSLGYPIISATGGSALTLTTTGTSGVATFSSGTLNIPNYTYTLPTASTSVLGGVKVDGTTITISGGVISAATGGAGTVSSVSVVTANGLAGTVATATSTPAITLSTTVTGILKGNGTAISAATAGTDYIVPATAFTTGSVPFANSSGQLAQDNTNFFWDNTNKRLGIGITSPTNTLQVQSTAAASFNIAGTGSVASTFQMSDTADATNFALWRNVGSTGGNTNFKNVPNSFALQANNAGGLILATNALSPAPIIFAVGTTFSSEVGRFTTAGTFQLASLTNGLVKSTSGVLSNATAGTDYENPLTFSSPLVRTTNTISIPAATSSVNGYLTSTDWATFNAKQGAGNYITALTGDATASGPGSVALTLATVNSNVGTFNNVTVNAKGLVTAASNVSYLTANQSITLSGHVTGTGTTAITTSTASKLILQGTTDATAPNAQFLGALGTGLLKNTTSTGVLSIAASADVITALGYTPYNATNPNGYTSNTGTVTNTSVVTANGFAGTVATSTTTPALTLTTTITGLLKGNGTAISAASAGTDYQIPITLTTTGSGAATFNTTTGALNIPTPSASATPTTTHTVTQTTHGFTVGQVLYLNSTTYTLAANTSAAVAEVVGIVSTVIDANNFTLTTEGYVTGLTGLTAGTTYFLGTGGALTATQTTTAGTVDMPLFVADSTTSGYFHKYRSDVVLSPTAPVYSIVTKTSAYTATLTDYTILGDATAASFTIALPTAASALGQIFNVKKTDSTANTVTIDPAGSETIQGTGAAAATLVLGSQGSSATFQSNGVGWFVL